MATSISSAVTVVKVHQHEEDIVYHGDEEILALAHRAVRGGLIGKDVLDNLTSLHPQVPKSMALRYLKDACNGLGDWNTTIDTPSESDNQLGPEQALDLIEILVKYAFKWRLIGTALRFQSHDLDNIQTNHASMVDSLKHNLIRLVEDWLQQKHNHTLPPTRNSLQQALRSSIVELGDVACELVTKYRQSVAENTLPYSIITVSEDLRSESVTTEVVHTEENKSILLEVQCQRKDVTYQWLQNEKLFHAGSTGPILYLNGDINMDGYKYSCAIRSGLPSYLTTIPITLEVGCPLDIHRQGLASMYLALPEVPEDTWPPQTSKKYVNLALIKQDTVLNYRNKCVRETIRNDIDDVFQHKEKIEYCEVLNSLKGGQVLFVEGRPGCGKTTFVHKITKDWTITHHGPIRLVLLVSLRVLNILYLQKPTIDLSDILKLFNKLRVSKEVMEKRDGKGVCFIFDGLDEFSPCDGNDSIVFEMLNKSYLSQSTIIVASRPAAIAKWRGKANKVVEVLGFLKEQILEYFDSYHFSEELKSAEVRTYLLSHPNVLHMCYLPIHSAMVAYLYEVTGEIPRTETEIYTHFTRSTLMRSLSKNVKVDVGKIDVTHLCGNEENLFRQICKLALEKTVKNKQVLRQDELFENKVDEDTSLGLITIDRIADLYNYKNIYTFLHLTFQEYLAAHHISTLTDEEQRELIHEHGGKDHMLVVWKFYCGLVKFDSTGSMFKAVVNKTASKTLHNIQCAYEAQQPIACNLVLENTDSTLNFQSLFLTTSDFTALGYVLANKKYPISLSLIHCVINSAGIAALLSETGNSNTCLLQELKYSADSFDDIMLGCLEKLLFFSRSLQCLHLSASHATTQLSLDTISSTISKSCSCLTELRVRNILIGPNNARYVLSRCRQLKKLALYNGVGEEELTILAAKLKDCGSLELLNLELLNISCDILLEMIYITNGIAKIFELCSDFHAVNFDIMGQKINLSLSRDPTESLDRYGFSNSDRSKRLNTLKIDCLSEQIVSNSAVGIKYIRHLEALTISNYRHSQVALMKLINNLDRCRSLRILNLDGANLTAAGAVAISSSLKHCTALTVLNLRGSRIKKEGAQALSASHQYWPNLQELNLNGTNYHSNIGIHGVVVLAKNLQFFTCLSKLHLEYNYIDDEVAELLLLNKRKNLTELHLHGNPAMLADTNPAMLATNDTAKAATAGSNCIML